MTTRRSSLLLCLFALTLALATAWPVSAHDEFRFVGSVTKTDLAKNQITVKYKEFDGKEDVVTVTLNAKTKITRDNKTVAKAELRSGVNVVVDALGCDDDFEAVAIKIVPAVQR